ncbi:MAG: hypothetical protein K9L68_10260 [Spirochaetales bacterium]|nr:hypothetical protein [Spirochaetales bacterium]MCF7938967.1 hypothetical protein [Spirochaetales bacterium]
MSPSPEDQEKNSNTRQGRGRGRKKDGRRPAREAPAREAPGEKHPVVGYNPSAGGEKGETPAGPFLRLLKVLGVERVSRFKSG